MASQVERSGARKMSGEDQMMFQDHAPYIDKVRSESKLRLVEVDENKKPFLTHALHEDIIFEQSTARCIFCTISSYYPL